MVRYLLYNDLDWSPNTCCDCYYDLVIMERCLYLSHILQYFTDYHVNPEIRTRDLFMMTCTKHNNLESVFTKRSKLTKEEWDKHQSFLKKLFRTEKVYADPRSGDNGWIELRVIARKFFCMDVLASVIRYEISLTIFRTTLHQQSVAGSKKCLNIMSNAYH